MRLKRILSESDCNKYRRYNGFMISEKKCDNKLIKLIKIWQDFFIHYFELLKAAFQIFVQLHYRSKISRKY